MILVLSRDTSQDDESTSEGYVVFARIVNNEIIILGNDAELSYNTTLEEFFQK
jgi:hypothetical protein